MGKRKFNAESFGDEYSKNDIPESLDDHSFYGLTLDEEQKIFRDSIWSDDYDIIFCDAKAGTGKTLMTVATACLQVSYGKYDGIIYIVSPVQEGKTGYLPGSAEDKIIPYARPLKDALIKIGFDPDAVINQAPITIHKNSNAFIDFVSHTYLRGGNFNNKIVILDESQNMYLDEMKKVLTRINDDCKAIVIGHSGQCDIYHNPERSGFTYYKEWYSTEKRAKICELSMNHRGWISTHADAIDTQKVYESLKAKNNEDAPNQETH